MKQIIFISIMMVFVLSCDGNAGSDGGEAETSINEKEVYEFDIDYESLRVLEQERLQDATFCFGSNPCVEHSDCFGEQNLCIPNSLLEHKTCQEIDLKVFYRPTGTEDEYKEMILDEHYQYGRFVDSCLLTKQADVIVDFLYPTDLPENLDIRVEIN